MLLRSRRLNKTVRRYKRIELRTLMHPHKSKPMKIMIAITWVILLSSSLCFASDAPACPNLQGTYSTCKPYPTWDPIWPGLEIKIEQQETAPNVTHYVITEIQKPSHSSPFPANSGVIADVTTDGVYRDIPATLETIHRAATCKDGQLVYVTHNHGKDTAPSHDTTSVYKKGPGQLYMIVHDDLDPYGPTGGLFTGWYCKTRVL